MSIIAAIYPALTGYAPLTSLVGHRVYPIKALDPVTAPYLVYSSPANIPQNSLGGSSACDNTRVQVDCWATTYASALVLADLVRTAIAQPNAAYRGLCIGTQDGPPELGIDLYRQIVEFSLWST